MVSPLSAELAHRQGTTLQVLAIFHARAGQWIAWDVFAAVAPCSWRTRIADARRIVKADGFAIEWNGNPKASMYRLVPQPLGRDATVPAPERQDRTLFPLHKSAAAQ